MISIASLIHRYDTETGTLDGIQGISKKLSDLRGSFADHAAYNRALQEGNPVVYTVSTVTPAEGDGALHYGLGILFPGTVGDEYYLTRGHFHSWRSAAEVYVGLKGEGRMVLEDETSGESHVVELLPDSIVYVPGHTAHRTVNVGPTPLVYLGIYPARAGHDYEKLALRNFRTVIIRRNTGPVALGRAEYLLNKTP